MTLLKPTLRINRLKVFQGGHSALDIGFHQGVNIIRGRNSSGKTTVMDLLAFSLGSENIPWKPEALECSNVYVEVALNDSVACLRRDIAEERQRPMQIFWGSLDAGLNAGPQSWSQYPFRRTESQMSFSQALFSALGMPEAQGEGASNITMHQVMRFLYADQPSVHSPIFREDGNFDTALMRETVGNYLCGIYDEHLYAAQLRIREIESSLTHLDSELRGIYRVLARSQQTPDLVVTSDRIVELEAARDKLVLELVRLKESRTLTNDEEKEARNVATTLRVALNKARANESKIKDLLDAEQLNIADTNLFVTELEARLRSLDESSETRSYLGNVNFAFCPSCLSTLDGDRSGAHHCTLCLSALGSSKGDTQILRMRNELSIQLKESQKILERGHESVLKLSGEARLATAEIRRLVKEYNTVATSWSSEVETTIEEKSRRLGALEEEIRQAYEQQKLASVIAELQGKRDGLKSELAEKVSLVDRLKLSQENRKTDISNAVQSVMFRLLKQDLALTPQFMAPTAVGFSFSDNSISVNGARNFSESSAVMLRHLFHLAMLSVSTKKDYMRLPRFMMLDGIDDGGMEEERSHQLQEIIVGECDTFEVDYQIIVATKNVNPKFDTDTYTVDRRFTPDARSLDVRPL